MKNLVIKTREDGFKMSYATYKDFSRFQKLVKELSAESRCQFTPWLFQEKPPLKIKIGQIIAKLSLIPIFRQIIKKILPIGYIFAIKTESKESQLVGFMYSHKFQRRKDGSYTATFADVIAEGFRGMGLSTFQRQTMYEVVKRENISYMIVDIFHDNKSSIPFYEKTGWEKIGTERNILLPCGKMHDIIKYRKAV